MGLEEGVLQYWVGPINSNILRLGSVRAPEDAWRESLSVAQDGIEYSYVAIQVGWLPSVWGGAV